MKKKFKFLLLSVFFISLTSCLSTMSEMTPERAEGDFSSLGELVQKVTPVNLTTDKEINLKMNKNAPHLFLDNNSQRSCINVFKVDVETPGVYQIDFLSFFKSLESAQSLILSDGSQEYKMVFPKISILDSKYQQKQTFSYTKGKLVTFSFSAKNDTHYLNTFNTYLTKGVNYIVIEADMNPRGETVLLPSLDGSRYWAVGPTAYASAKIILKRGEK